MTWELYNPSDRHGSRALTYLNDDETLHTEIVLIGPQPAETSPAVGTRELSTVTFSFASIDQADRAHAILTMTLAALAAIGAEEAPNPERCEHRWQRARFRRALPWEQVCVFCSTRRVEG